MKQCPIGEIQIFDIGNIPGHSVCGQTLCGVTRRCRGVLWAHVGYWKFMYVSFGTWMDELVVGNNK